MLSSPLDFTTSPNTRRDSRRIALPLLEQLTQDYLLDCQYRLQQPTTLATRRIFIKNLLWFLEHRKLEGCGSYELKQFFVYISSGHEEPGGRWGNSQLTKPVRPITIKDYFVTLRVMFRWFVEDGALDFDPMDGITKPKVQTEQIRPFSPDQITALLEAAKRSTHALRDEAIVLFLLDTGLRASELCNLKQGDVDLIGRRCVVLGKGNKQRAVYFGRTAGRALTNYLRRLPQGPELPVFRTGRGENKKEPFQRNGLQQLIERLGKVAELSAVRCSPHTFRHTFAVEFLRAGGNVFSLKELMGHTTLHMTNKYVALAQADIENQHRQFSPADRIKRQ